MQRFQPEGKLINTIENKSFLRTPQAMKTALLQNKTLEAKALLCDNNHNLIVELPFGRGIIPRNEGAIGIESGETKDIALLSRVNKPVCFKVIKVLNDEDSSTPLIILSRRLAQEECIEYYLGELKSGDIIPARVTHLEQFGCFVDIGCGIASLIPIDAISVSRIAHPADRFRNGDDIFVVIKTVENGRICLTHKELLGTWEENASLFMQGETVGGIIRSVEDYGVFVELTPNLAGLAEPYANAAVGQSASVYIKSIIPEKMKIKLIIVDVFERKATPEKLSYYINNGSISEWIYSTPQASKNIISIF